LGSVVLQSAIPNVSSSNPSTASIDPRNWIALLQFGIGNDPRDAALTDELLMTIEYRCGLRPLVGIDADDEHAEPPR
jgi:hypothetical protein